MKLLIRLTLYLKKSRAEVKSELAHEKDRYKQLVSHHLEIKGRLEQHIQYQQEAINKYKQYFKEVDMTYKDLT